MYYLELIERFWKFNQIAKPGSTVVAIYLYLLKTGKHNNAYQFNISDSILSKELRLTRKTVKKTKEKLRDLGLIEFKTENGFPGSYRLILNYPVENLRIEKVNNVELESEAFVEGEKNKKILSDSNSEIIEATDIVLEAIVKSSTLSDNDKIPSFTEFLNYAKTLETYHSELDILIGEKYDQWKNNGWKNNSGRPITIWRSSLKSTFPFLKNIVSEDLLSLKTLPDIKRPDTNCRE